MVYTSDFLWIVSEMNFATTLSAWTEGWSSSNLSPRLISIPHLLDRQDAHSPQEAVRVCADSGRAHAGVTRALVQLVHARVHRARDIERRGTIQEPLWLIVHVGEERIRVEQRCEMRQRWVSTAVVA